MKNNLFVLSLLMAATLVGCSEGAYTPSTGLPVNNVGVPYQPNMPMNNYPNYNNQFQTMPYQQMYPMYQNQNMLSWNMRMNIPGFYLYNYQYRSCIPRRTYTTTCNQRTVRRNCQYVYTRTTTDTSVTTSTQTDTSTNTSVVVNTETTTNTSTDTSTTRVLPISWKDEDAQALYQRLAKEEETVEKDRFLNKGVKARTGEHYQCIVDGNEKKAKNYVCDLEIRINDGILLQQSPIGKDGQAVISDAMMHKGDLLNIGGFGEAPEVGYLTIAGPSAQYLYQNFSVEAVDGKVDEAGIMEAKIKTLGQVKCYQTTGTVSTTTECLIKINAKTGSAINF